MPDKKLCPTCHTEIGKWTDDPILTPRGLSGDDYKGVVPIKVKHIKELQDTRKQQEIEATKFAPEMEKTDFSTIPPKTPVNKKHINELRTSTEKLLSDPHNVSATPLLYQYFNYDSKANYIGTYKYGNKVEDKREWVDIDCLNRPKMPKKTEDKQNLIKIKAIHIEDLRHPIPEPYFLEDWKHSPLEIYTDSANILFYGRYFKKWAVSNLSPSQSIEIQSGKIIMKTLRIPNIALATILSFYRYSSLGGYQTKNYRLPKNGRLYIDSLNIKIPPLEYYIPPPTFNKFIINVVLRTVHYDLKYYHYTIALTEPIQVLDIYNNMVEKYGSEFENYYNGVVDNKGCIINEISFNLTGAFDINWETNEASFGSIKVI